MIDKMGEFNQRIGRLAMAARLEKVDRTPVVAWVDGFAANHLGVKMSEYSSNPFVAGETTLRFFQAFPEFDASEMAFTPVDIQSYAFLSKCKIAGRDLPEGSPWIVDEQERISIQDYDKILEIGWESFYNQFIFSELNATPAYLQSVQDAMMKTSMEYFQSGIPIYTVALSAGIPLEALAGGRTMAKFIQDLYRMPDKIQAVMDVMIETYIAQLKMALASMPQKPFSVFVGIARGASEFLSPKLWNRFVYPYLTRTVNAVIEEGVIANLHFDSCWDRDLHLLKQFPKGSCIFACDHTTDIYKIKEVLGDTMAIKGDVPSPLLAFGTPDEVYAYCTKLIRDMGNGFILAPACTMPANAKVENVKAMLAAATGK